ncbi:MAG: prepilin-type N-terminal cleavage/methylation domain-containing protein [Planctomycetota bacterium]
MRERGFTLIEMLLVMAIIGFLVGIIVPAIGDFGTSAKDRTARGDVRQLKTAVEVYCIEYGAYPATANWGTSNSTLLDSGYNRMVDSFPTDPWDGTTIAGSKYQYDLDEAGKDTYIIASEKAGTVAVVATNDGADLNGATIYGSNAKATTP